MKLSEYPNLSEYFRESVLKKYADHNTDPELALSFVNNFLKEYPYYSEALLFKARMLMALLRYKEASTLLDACEKIDEWRTIYKYDKSEVLFIFNQRSEAIELIKSTIELSLRDILEGIENFLLGIDVDVDEVKRLRDMIKKEMMMYLSNENYSIDFKTIMQELNDHKLWISGRGCLKSKTVIREQADES